MTRQHGWLNGAWPTVLALAIVLTACDDSTTDPPDPPVEVTHTIRSVDAVPARFFRLTAPVSFYFTDTDSFPEPLQDQSLSHVRSEQNQAAPWQIDYSSLRVYRSMGPGLSQHDTIDNAVAYLDPKGIGFEGFGPGTGLTPGDSGPSPGYPYSGFDPVIALTELPQQFRERWEPLSAPEEWSVIEVNGQIVGIQLSESALSHEVVAVSYDIVDALTGDVVRRVGRSSEDGEDGRIVDPNDPERTINYFKLLKPGGPVRAPFEDGAYTEFALAWEYEFRNFYDLGGSNIPPEDLAFRILSTHPAVDPPDRLPTEIDVGQTPLVRVFGLDQRSRSGALGPDGIADIEDPNLFYLEPGYLRFPDPTPMNLSDEEIEEYTDGVLDFPESWRSPRLYTEPLTDAERFALNHFNFEVRWLE